MDPNAAHQFPTAQSGTMIDLLKNITQPLDNKA